MVKSIAVITGSRAEYGLLTTLIEQIRDDHELELQLVVTGAHLAPEFGMTIDEIRSDGVPIADEVEMLLSSDSATGMAKSAGLAMVGFADSFRRLRPDIAIVLGDRFEILAAASAAMLMKVPVAHLHGGERTEGAVDESIRHAITKMSQLHFVSTAEYARRVIQLGEDPGRVFNVGAIGLDRIDRDRLLSKNELAAALGIPADRPWCTVSYHPVTTLAAESDESQFRELLEGISGRPDVHYVMTRANADAGGRRINAIAAQFAARATNASLFDSLGSRDYLGVVAASACMVGNSSSGIIEAPFLRVPVIDVGARQQGRVRGPSVVHVEAKAGKIRMALDRVLAAGENWDFEAHPYHAGGAARQILRVVKRFNASIVKTFHDLPPERV